MLKPDLEWKIICLETGTPSKQVGAFLKSLWPSKVSSVYADEHDVLTGNHISGLLSQFRDFSGKILTVYGSGRFHHYTYGLVKNIADLRRNNYTYVHIDQHSDDADFTFRGPNPLLHCGGFVYSIKKSKKVSAVKYIGCLKQFRHIEQEDLLTSQNFVVGSIEKNVRGLLANTSKDIYVSMDLDVLLDLHMQTAYKGGDMKIGTLINCLEYLKSEKNIISADALGLDKSRCHAFAPNHYLIEASFLVYAMIAGTLLGEDISALKKEHTCLVGKHLKTLW